MIDKFKAANRRLRRLARRTIAPKPKPVVKSQAALPIGIVGINGIGRSHMATIDRMRQIRLAAVSDSNAALVKKVGTDLGIPWYTDYHDLLKDDMLKAVIVATPSHLHASMAIEALEAGKHVLVEKPIALTVGDADRVVARAKELDLCLSVSHQHRTQSRYLIIKRLIEEDTLGDVMRAVWSSYAMRTQAYYDESRWRSSWAGGGGALLNQYIHDIDMICGLFGEPVEVSGKISNLAHESQVDDLASGVLMFRSGVSVLFQVGLFDATGNNYIEIVGNKATVKKEENAFQLSVVSTPLRQFIRESTRGYGAKVNREERRIPIKEERIRDGHAAILADFEEAIREGRSPIVSGEAGRTALEVANGLILSSITGQHVSLPLDRDAFERVFAELQAGEIKIDDWNSSDTVKASEKRRMTTLTEQQLSMLGGPKSVTVKPKENWSIPKERIKSAVCNLIDRGVYTEMGGGTIEKLEKRFASYTGAKYCLAQNNGTSTLWGAYYALGIGPGDEVLHPAYTWICSIAPAVHLGAKPVFCEITPENLTIDPTDMENRITPRTKAISIVHIHGNVCDMDAIMSIADKHGLPVIEDCSHCTGAEWDGKKLGTIGAIGCFSMQGNPITGKPLPAGEGGLVVTDDSDLYERMLFFGHLNRADLAGTFSDSAYRQLAPTNSGIKFRPHPWGMACGLVLLDGLEERNEKRRQYCQKIYAALADLPGVETLYNPPKAVPAGFHGGMPLLYQPQELGGLPIDDFVEALRAEGVSVNRRRPDYVTHRLKLFAEGHDLYGTGGPLTNDYPGYPPGSLPITEDLSNRIITMRTFIEETRGYSDQAIIAFRKVSAHYATLQTKQAKLRILASRTTRTAVEKAKSRLRRLDMSRLKELLPKR